MTDWDDLAGIANSDELMAEIGEMERANDRLAVLLRALRQEFGDQCFDGSRISCRVADNPTLLAPLDAVLGDMRLRRGFLAKGSLSRLQRWLEGAVEYEAGGLWITGDAQGWRYVVPVQIVEEHDVALAMLAKRPPSNKAWIIGRDADTRELSIEQVATATISDFPTWGRA